MRIVLASVPRTDIRNNGYGDWLFDQHGRLFIDYLSVLKRRTALSKWTKERDKYPGFIRRLTPAEVAQHHHRDEEL